MLLRRATLEGIADGTVKAAFRRGKEPATGSRLVVLRERSH